MSSSNTTNGKAFEYACLSTILSELQKNNKSVSVIDDAAYQTAKEKFFSLDQATQTRYLASANSAAKLIFPLEPQLEYGSGILQLSVNPDAAAMGVEGDVRDVLCIRSDDWEIGLSCKHNHAALKHPRITADKDFGKSWIGVANSQDFIAEISDTVDVLVEYQKNNVLWKDIEEDKQDMYYVPILNAYKAEINRMCQSSSDVPARLLSYFFGAKDFYKVIMKESQQTTTIEAFNMSGTLGQKCGNHRPLVKIPTLRMPTRLIEADYKQDSQGNPSKTTIVLIFDGGWTVSMRLHNKDKTVKPTSLAWDIQLVGLPTDTYVNTRAWYE